MSADGRYPYHHPHPGIHYEYGPYHAPVYDNAHYPPNQTQQQQPPLQRPMPPPNYHPQYPPVPPHYGLPQWSPESWPQYGFTQHPPPMQDPAMNPGATRPDMNSNTPVDHNRYPQPLQVRQPESSISGANQPLSDAPQTAPAQDRPKPQASESSSSPVVPASTTIDFMKILDSYRMIMESSSAFVNDSALNASGRAPTSDVMEKMMTSATVSFTMLGAGLKEVDGRKAENGASAEQNGNGHLHSATPTNAQTNEPSSAHEGQTCLGCKATSTPEWRRGPMGPRTLCNACGLVYAKLIKKRGREARAARVNGKSSKGDSDNPDDLSADDGGSDDDEDDDGSSVDEG